jgi:hypothetical protein
VLRPSVSPDQARRQETRDKYLAKLAREQAVFRRWMSRLKRAFHALEKSERKLARLKKTGGWPAIGLPPT